MTDRPFEVQFKRAWINTTDKDPDDQTGKHYLSRTWICLEIIRNNWVADISRHKAARMVSAKTRKQLQLFLSRPTKWLWNIMQSWWKPWWRSSRFLRLYRSPTQLGVGINSTNSLVDNRDNTRIESMRSRTRFTASLCSALLVVLVLYCLQYADFLT